MVTRWLMACCGVFMLVVAAPVMAAERIATLAPSLTELVYAAGAGGKLVGVSAYSDYPEAAKSLPIIADFSGANLEALLKLKPDLVLAWQGGGKAGEVERLRALGFTVVEIGIAQLEDVSPALTRIGELAATQAAAATAVQDIRVRIERLRMRYAARPKVTAFIEIGAKPLMTVNGKHFISGMLALCGADNVFADAPTLVLEPSREVLLQLQPQLVLHGVSARRLGGTGGSPARDVSVYEGTPAGRSKRFVGVNADHLFRPGPRLVDAAEVVCEGVEAARPR